MGGKVLELKSEQLLRQGWLQGREEGKAEGRAEGKAEGQVAGVALSARVFRTIMDDKKLNNEEIARRCECTVDMVLDIRKAFDI